MPSLSAPIRSRYPWSFMVSAALHAQTPPSRPEVPPPGEPVSPPSVPEIDLPPPVPSPVQPISDPPVPPTS